MKRALPVLATTCLFLLAAPATAQDIAPSGVSGVQSASVPQDAAQGLRTPETSAPETSAPEAGTQGQQPAAPIWYRRPFADNLRDCKPRPQPGWCETWMALMEAGRPRVTDPSTPEWQRISFERNLAICNVLLPPSWCGDWEAAMGDVMQQAAYKVALDTYLSGEAAKAEAAAREKAARDAWQAIADRIAANRQRSSDLAEVQRRVQDRDPSAMELLAWMHVQGRGVPRSYVRAYELYGDLILSGRKDLLPNLDALWRVLREEERQRMIRRFGTAPE